MNLVVFLSIFTLMSIVLGGVLLVTKRINLGKAESKHMHCLRFFHYLNY